jgi:hypothetical protein
LENGEKIYEFLWMMKWIMDGWVLIVEFAIINNEQNYSHPEHSNPL